MKQLLAEKCTAILENAVAQQFVSGASLLVLKDGKEVLSCQAGYRDLEQKLPMERDSIFRLYSMSKPVTGAAVMLLLERGMIDLVDPVSKYLPGFVGQKVLENGKEVPAQREVSIHDLLSMTSGLPYGDAGSPAADRAKVVFDEIDERLYSDNPLTLNEIANRLGECPLEFQPGARWMYGTSADILGAVVEVVSGLPFAEFLEKELFAPLGMSDTGFYVPEEKQNRLVKVYRKEADGLVEEKTNHLGIRYDMKVLPAFASGGAGLVSTLEDYSKFASMLLGGGELNGVRVLKPKTVEYFTAGSLTPWQMESFWRAWDRMTGFSYGNLMRVLKDPGSAQFVSTAGEYGWDGWLGCVFGNDPKNKLTFLFGMQRPDSGTTWLARQLRNLVTTELL
jgi:CubicO group peptidase (beta-lactamase class C family)